MGKEKFADEKSMDRTDGCFGDCLYWHYGGNGVFKAQKSGFYVRVCHRRDRRAHKYLSGGNSGRFKAFADRTGCGRSAESSYLAGFVFKKPLTLARQ